MAYFPKRESQELNVLVAQLNSILGANYFALRIDKENGPVNTNGGRLWLYYLYKTRLGVQDAENQYNYLVTRDDDGMYLSEMRTWLTGVVDGLKTYRDKLLTILNENN